MKDDSELSPVDQLSRETLKLADEMCERLSTKLSLDKRGAAVFYDGVLSDLDSVTRREYGVTVADINGQPWLTLISDLELPKTSQGLLVYRFRPDDHRRYVGRIDISRPGRRAQDATGHFFAMFDIDQDARR